MSGTDVNLKKPLIPRLFYQNQPDKSAKYQKLEETAQY